MYEKIVNIPILERAMEYDNCQAYLLLFNQI